MVLGVIEILQTCKLSKVPCGLKFLQDLSPEPIHLTWRENRGLGTNGTLQNLQPLIGKSLDFNGYRPTG